MSDCLETQELGHGRWRLWLGGVAYCTEVQSIVRLPEQSSKPRSFVAIRQLEVGAKRTGMAVDDR